MTGVLPALGRPEFDVIGFDYLLVYRQEPDSALAEPFSRLGR